MEDGTTFDLWKYAARYRLVELEVYCRSNHTVLGEIKGLLMDPAAGLDFFLGFGIPSKTLDNITRSFLQQLDRYESNQYNDY